MRTTLIGLACISVILGGCGDALPPSPDPSQGSGSYKLAFSEVREGIEKAMVILTNADGSGRTEIAPGGIFGPAGNDNVAFVRNDTVFVATWQNGTWNIRSIYGGSVSQRISYASVSISPDGRLVTFTTRAKVGDSDHLNTYLAATDGSGIGLPLQVATAKGYTPVFSRDGRKLAFFGVPRMGDNSFFNPGKLYVFNTNGSSFYSIVDFKKVGADGGVSIDFSPDGSKVVYGRKDDDTEIPTVRVANVDGSGTPREIATGAFSPIWSHDGTKILYTGGFNYDIMMKNADGSGTPVNLTNTAGQVELYLRLSPDGKKLAYSVFPGDVENNPAVIKVMDMDNPSNMATICSAGYMGFWVPGGRQ